MTSVKPLPGTPSRNIRRKSLLPTFTNDDEAERKQLRREAELEAKLANISISQANNSNIFAPGSEEPVEINLSDHFNTCLHMFTKNLYKKQQPVQKLNELEVSNYEFDNENDREFCSISQTNKGWERDTAEEPNIDSEGVFPLDFEDNSPLDASSKEDSFYVQADIVSPTFLPYAMTAKKMDMKKLKNAMWNELTGSENKMEDPVPNQNPQVKTTTLQTVYKELPKKISPSMTENLSGSLAFVALLHLANEHSLDLEQVGVSDVVIKKRTN